MPHLSPLAWVFLFSVVFASLCMLLIRVESIDL
nr:ATP synthase F0 subunit 8 [Parantropora penelope]